MKTKITIRQKLLGSSQLGWDTCPSPANSCNYLKFKKFHLFVFLFLFSSALIPTESFAQVTTGFELDGNATSVSPNPPDDWDLIANRASSAQVTTGILTDPPPPKNADNLFTVGSKDINDISTWHWTLGSVPDKDEILHAGAALYDGNKIYFFADRFTTEGDAQIGFWLFKNAVSTNTLGTFNGIHAVGDILLLTNFVNGGGTPVIAAYEWVGSGGSDGALNLISVSGANIFAITNSSVATSPWPYTPKFGADGSFPIGAFFEGGIDLNGLGLGINPCFTSFLVESRSSSAVTAELKDFVFGSFFTKPQVTVNSAVRCINGDPAILTASVQGGAQPPTYIWTPEGATTPSISVSPSVTTIYTVMVTAQNGCAADPAMGTVTVNQIPSCSIGNPGPGNLLCNHGNYTISTSVDPALYNLQWSLSVDGSPSGWDIVGTNTLQTITFSAGNCDTLGFLVHFFLTVTDKATLCSSTCNRSFAPSAPPCNVLPITSIPLTCTLTSEYLKASYSTGIINPTLLWTRNGSSIGAGLNRVIDATTSIDSISISLPGTYVFSVTDPSQTSITCNNSVTVTQNTATPVISETHTNVTCNGLRNGAIDLSVSGPTSTLTYSWSTDASSQDISGLPAGSYTVTVSGANGCILTKVIVITQPDLLVLNAQKTDVLCNGAGTGAITASVTGGISPYKFAINTGTFSSNNVFNNLIAGNYTIHAKDSNSCEKTATVTINQPPVASCTLIAPNPLPICGSTSNSINATVSNAVSYTWTVVGAGWAITSGQGTSSVMYTAGQDTGYFKLVIANANNCKDSCKVKVPIGSCIRVSNFCSLTQGFYGQTKGVACASGEKAIVLVTRLLGAPFGNLVIGKTGHSLVITQARANCVIKRMPGGGPSAVLPAGDQVFDINCNTTIPLNSEGRFNNTLLGQAIALGFNLRLDAHLGALIIPGTTFTTMGGTPGVDGKCGTTDDVPVFTDLITKSIPQSVLTALNTLYGSQTVANLFDLANRALGGQLTAGASLTDINAAVSAINEGFDHCRFLQISRVNASKFGISSSAERNNDIIMKAYPNPFEKSTTIEFSAKTDVNVNVNVYTITGVRVVELFNGKVKADEVNQVIFNGENLPNGIYIYKITVDNNVYFDKLILQK